MNKSIRILALILALYCALPILAAAESQWMNAHARQVLEEVNMERRRYGLNELRLSPELSAAAQTRALEISVKCSHTRPDGSRWSTVSPLAKGENIARGQKTADKVMAAWMSSPGHRANILQESFGSIGVACVKVDGIYHWVQLFGR